MFGAAIYEAAMQTKIRWSWAIATTVCLEIVSVAAAFAWVALYSYVLAPGQTEAAYEAYARDASPIVALVVGPLVYFAAGRRLGATAIAAAVLHGVIDLAILAMWSRAGAYHAAMTIASGALKLAAAYGGATAVLAWRRARAG